MVGESKDDAPNSKTKFHPTIVKQKYKNALLCPSNNNPLKNVKHPSPKINVLIIGVITQLKIMPRFLFLFFKNLNINPDTKPAKDVLSKTINIVPNI